ncbi:MAG: hypothetical protein FGM57_01745 [Candidatus Taylorbacteria bacterium]|nr:hypothetical protein [Candidatus Taylorbacteria bacterium]
MPNDGKIEELKKRLYSNAEENAIAVQRRAKLPKHSVMVGSDWREDAENVNPVVEVRKYDPNRGSIAKKIFTLALICLLFAGLFAGYMVFSGANSVSNSNIDIKMLGPIATPAGEELSVDIDITNRNKTDLILADLVILYPEGTRSARDHITPLPNDRVPIGTIKPGQTVRQTVKSVLFGEENLKKGIRVSLEYRIEGSSNIFVKDKDYPIFIGSSPIAVDVDSFKEIIPGQYAEFKITVKSNSTNVIKGLVLKAEYPYGFEYISAFPVPSSENTTWVLGDVKPGEERIITLKGSLIGGDSQERVFRFYTGTENPEDKNDIGTIFVTNAVPIALKRPFLGADVSLDGKTASTHIARAGVNVKGEITWQNNLPVPLTDVVVEARFGGEMLDKLSIEGERGFYRSIDNTIMWDRTTLADLKEIPAGAVGRVQFSFAPLPPTLKNNSEFRRQTLTFDLTVKAKRLDEDNVPQEISSTVTKTIKVSSDLGIKSKLVRSVGPFENTGPSTPVPDQRTTYTVMVSLNNSYNNVKDVVYRATLPPYVEWLGITHPGNAGVKYNEDTRELTWTVGDLAAGTGFSASAKEFAYQVSFLPSLGQVGQTPQIITKQSIRGRDTFTGGIVEQTVDDLDTKLESDPGYKFGEEKVGGGR